MTPGMYVHTLKGQLFLVMLCTKIRRRAGVFRFLELVVLARQGLILRSKRMSDWHA